MILFQRSVKFESGYAPNVIPITRGRRGGFAGLGSEATDAQKNIFDSVQNFVETLTGSKAARETQDRALELARVNAEKQQEIAVNRSAGWAQATPWLAVAGALAVVGITALVLKR